MIEPLLFGIILVGLSAAVLGLFEIGRLIGIARRNKNGETERVGLGVVDGAIFGLTGLIIAFTFSGAAGRFDTRRQVIGQEANAIGTAYLRLDLLPEASQPQLRDDFREYLDARLSDYKNLSRNAAASTARQADATALQRKIWSEAVAASREAPVSTTMLVLQSVNDMIDITTTRAVALQTHPPAVIHWALLVLVLASALLAGHAMAESRQRNWIHMLLYTVIMATAVYLIFDLEYPRLGLVRIDAADQVLIDLRTRMN